VSIKFATCRFERAFRMSQTGAKKAAFALAKAAFLNAKN
jgi:hypothetical protein